MASKFPKPGEMFEGIYKIERILGAGGFARIYKGIESGIERDVALKLLRPPVRTDQSDTQRDKYLKTVTERFQREAVMLSKLKSPHTVTMFSYGQTQSGLLYMVLEFIDGQTLTELRRSQERIAPHRIVKILRQVLISLKEAHAMGMLHRDLKPGNIMIYEHLGAPDQIKLLDFGIAKLIGDAAKDSTTEDLTSDGTLIGTPRYMAPEQIQGKPVGPSSDLYALGLVGYELCVGQRAIEGDSSIQIIGQQLTPESFSVPESANIPDRLRAVINKMMEKDTARRYQTASEILEDLEHPALLEYMELGDIPSIEMALIELSSPTDDIEVFAEEAPRDQRKLVIGAILFTTLLLIGFGVALFASNPEPEVVQVEEKPEQIEKKIVQISIKSKSNGVIAPASINIDGVDIGFTPLTIDAAKVENATVVATYTDPSTLEKLVSTQDVKTPRDLIFEFAPQVAAHINTGDIAVEEEEIEVKKETKKKQRKKYKKEKKDEDLKLFEKKKEEPKVERKDPGKKVNLMEADIKSKDKKVEKEKKSLLDF